MATACVGLGQTPRQERRSPLKRHRISFALAAAAILLLLSTVILIFYDFAARLRYHYHEAAAALLLRAVLLCLLLTALLVLVGFILFLLQKEKTRRLVTERGQFYLLSHFANTCLFELSYETGGLRLSDNLPPGLDLPPEARSLTGAALFRSLLHGEDRPRVEALYRNPPAAGREAALEFRLRHRDGSYVWYECKSIAIHDSHGAPMMLMGRFEDIDARKAREEALIARSTLDDLTGLLNKSAFAMRLEEWRNSPCAKGGGALLMLDLDNFKSINDSCGHATGDNALRLTAQILRETFRGSDVLARAGGDEFLIFMPGAADEALVRRKADEVCRALAARSGDGRGSYRFTCSVGAAFYPRNGRCFADLFQAADAAMYRAKREGKDAYCITDGENGPPPCANDPLPKGPRAQ